MIAAPVLAVILVTSTSDSGIGSLRQAIDDANMFEGRDEIHFNLSATPTTICPGAPLPEIVDEVEIDATTQPGYINRPAVALSGRCVSTFSNGLRIEAKSTIKGLAVIGWPNFGIFVGTAGAGSRIEKNHLGINAAGNSARANKMGLVIFQSPRNIVRDNIISGNIQYGVMVVGPLARGNFFRRNRIGTDWRGRYAPHTRIVENLVSGNLRHGVNLDGGPPTLATPEPHFGNKGYTHQSYVLGNLVGTDVTGTHAVPNGLRGVLLSRSQNNTVEDNTVSGNSKDGIGILSSNDPHSRHETASRNHIIRNRIGTDNTGRHALPNVGRGIYITSGFRNYIGYKTSAGNLIAHNTDVGIEILRLHVSSNRVGTTNIVFSNRTTP